MGERPCWLASGNYSPSFGKNSSLTTPAGTMTTTPIESKWVSRKWRAEARTIEGRFGHGVLATKTITDTDHAAWAIPAPVLALLLE